MAFCNPPQRMLYVLCTAEMLIENKKKEVVWNDMKRHIVNSGVYLQRFVDFNMETVTFETAQLIRQRINNDPDCTVDNLSKISSAVSKILAWLLAVLE